MTAEVHLLCGPAGSGKSERLLDSYRQSVRVSPGRALWLGPTPRAVEVARTRLLAGQTVLLGPRLLSFAQFFEEIVRQGDPAAGPLSQVQQRLLIEDVTTNLAKSGQLTYFQRVADTRGFTEGLLNQVSELKRQGVSPTRFARAAYQHGVDGRTISSKERQCARLYARYEHELRRQRLLDVEGRANHALDLLQRGLWRPFEAVRAIYLDGFADFTVAQMQALNLLAHCVEQIWITLPDETEGDRAELFLRSRATQEKLVQTLGASVECLRPKSCGMAAIVSTNGRGANLSAWPEVPLGLLHLERQLFQPLRALQRSACADGLHLIEAPGELGEARLVARSVKTLLLQGTPAERVMVALRDVSSYADLLSEVFDEYGIPLEVEGNEPLTRNPAVAFLLRAVRLPEDDWPFAGVTALLRNSYFRPGWDESRTSADMAQHAEALLRLLGEPRGRAAYLTAVARWAEQQQPGLEDEQAEESRRRRTHELARLCQPYLLRFFAAWDSAPHEAALEQHLIWLREFAADLGLRKSADEEARARAALNRLGEELDHWLRREQRRGLAAGPRLDRKTFLRRLGAVAVTAGLPRTDRGPGRVLALSAESARHLDVDQLFVMGLSERSFPRLSLPPTLLDERERHAFKQAGVDLVSAADLAPDEMLLFYQLVCRPRRGLTLSYPAVDERGQGLLPSSFLTAVLDCFEPNTVPVERRRMLIERQDSDIPLSMAEYRVRVAARSEPGTPVVGELPNDLRANLTDANRLFVNRMRARQHNAYDGLLRDRNVLNELAGQFGPERILSPTGLEDYVTCPFRFFLGSVLRLEPLEDPREEIEVTRRGQAVHRALSRLHKKLKEDNNHQPDEATSSRVAAEIQAAVAEDVHRAPSPAAKQLWRLEGERLLRQVGRYAEQWQKFVKPWHEAGALPRPHLFEVDFGLPASPTTEGEPVTPHGPLILRDGDTEVRISGRIDRVDLVELEDGSVGFWIIDYKTGSATSYTATALTQFRRLQLTLYALAVEEVLLAGQSARPLGLAYWLVADSGAKVVLPGRGTVAWLRDAQRWQLIRRALQDWIVTVVGHIREGTFPLQPRDEDCTRTCHFGQICRIAQARSVTKEWSLPLPVLATAPTVDEDNTTTS